MLHCLSFGTDSLSTCSTEDSSSTPVYPQSSQCIRRTTFFSSTTGSTTLDTRADPIERAARGIDYSRECTRRLDISYTLGAAVDIVDISHTLGAAVDIVDMSHTLGTVGDSMDTSQIAGAFQMIRASQRLKE